MTVHNKIQERNRKDGAKERTDRARQYERFLAVRLHLTSPPYSEI
ncbi:hypothetical protein [Paenibacillus taichungensis]